MLNAILDSTHREAVAAELGRYADVARELLSASRYCDVPNLEWGTVRVLVSATQSGRLSTELPPVKHGLPQGVPALFHRARQQTFWGRVTLNVLREQLGRWAVARAPELQQLKDSLRCRYNVALRNFAERDKERLKSAYDGVRARLPTVRAEVARECYTPDIARTDGALAQVDKQVIGGERQAAMAIRFGLGVMCLPLSWKGIK